MSLEQKLARIDLNLLVPLSTLIKEKNVSKAADKLFMSQSAMSRTLQRLRVLFDDELFFRRSFGVVPTELALELGLLLPPILSSLEQLLEQKHFDPLHSDKHVVISLPSMLSHRLVLPLIKTLAKEAPEIRVSIFPPQIDVITPIDAGIIDFAVHITKPESDLFNVKTFNAIVPTVYARKDHPLTLLENITEEDCLSYNYVNLLNENSIAREVIDPVQTLLASYGFNRKILYCSTQLSLLTDIMLSSDLLICAGQFLFSNPEMQAEFVPIFTIDVEPQQQRFFYFIDHSRNDSNQAHQWIKGKFLDTIQEYLAEEQT